MAIEVSHKTWRLASTDLCQPDRMVVLTAWDQRGLVEEVARAKEHFHLPEEAPVYFCYEAGRCGFSLHRFLTERGYGSVVVTPASIEQPRRSKHRKTDRLDAARLVRLLVRYVVHGERQCWRVCRVPTKEVEAARRLDREYDRLKTERTAHVNRIRSLLALHGNGQRDVLNLPVEALEDYAGEALPKEWQAEIAREFERLALVKKQLAEVDGERNEALAARRTRTDNRAWMLMWFRGIGPVGAVALAREFFWRDFRNVREVGAAAGLTGCPYDSGTSRVEQGISKAGSRRIRSLAVELAWMWVRYQPHSALTLWFNKRFARGGKRMRRIGIVAVARKLLVALWKFLAGGDLPEGAIYEMEGGKPTSRAARAKAPRPPVKLALSEPSPRRVRRAERKKRQTAARAKTAATASATA